MTWKIVDPREDVLGCTWVDIYDPEDGTIARRVRDVYAQRIIDSLAAAAQLAASQAENARLRKVVENVLSNVQMFAGGMEPNIGPEATWHFRHLERICSEALAATPTVLAPDDQPAER